MCSSVQIKLHRGSTIAVLLSNYSLKGFLITLEGNFRKVTLPVRLDTICHEQQYDDEGNDDTTGPVEN